MMFELKNPDFTKTYEEREAIKESEGWKKWWAVEHQYPYILPARHVKRVWCNPFYLLTFSLFWLSLGVKTK